MVVKCSQSVKPKDLFSEEGQFLKSTLFSFPPYYYFSTTMHYVFECEDNIHITKQKKFLLMHINLIIT